MGYNNVDWFVDEVKKFDNKMNFYFKNTRIYHKDTTRWRWFQKNYICRICETNIESEKVRDHCHLTDNYWGPAQIKCNINVTQDQSIFIPLLFHNFRNYDCHLLSKNLVDKTNDKVKYKIIPKTYKEKISVRFGCIRFIDSYRFLSSSLDS